MESWVQRLHGLCDLLPQPLDHTRPRRCKILHAMVADGHVLVFIVWGPPFVFESDVRFMRASDARTGGRRILVHRVVGRYGVQRMKSSSRVQVLKTTAIAALGAGILGLGANLSACAADEPV